MHLSICANANSVSQKKKKKGTDKFASYCTCMRCCSKCDGNIFNDENEIAE